MKINILTLFPEFFNELFNYSIVKRAISDNHLELNIVNFRDFANNKHNRVDDTPYGGGSGMVLQVEPIHLCLNSLKSKGLVIALTPTGEVLNDKIVNELSVLSDITLICGHYEGFDERVFRYVDKSISIGDYILTGGETAALVVIEAVTRKLSGVINLESVENDSFAGGLLDYPVYTKPVVYDGIEVPSVLLSGNHQKIAEYRKEKAIEKTLKHRPDLLDAKYGIIDKIDKKS